MTSVKIIDFDLPLLIFPPYVIISCVHICKIKANLPPPLSSVGTSDMDGPQSDSSVVDDDANDTLRLLRPTLLILRRVIPSFPPAERPKMDDGRAQTAKYELH